MVSLSCRIERKDPRLPRFFIVPSGLLAGWALTGTTVVEATINGVAIGRRTVKPWDAERWFIELSQPLCDRAGVDTGDRIAVTLRLASEELPVELVALLASDARARAAWAKLTVAQQRMLRENILAAKTTETRRHRAKRGLTPFRQKTLPKPK